MRIGTPYVVNIEDLRALARRRLPRVVFDYLDGGAEGEATLRANRLAFDEVTFRARHAVTVPAPDLRVRVLGDDLSLPVLLAPVGYSRLMHPGGEVTAARVAGTVGTIYIQSTLSGHRLEDVAAAAPGRVWYQLYLIGGREVAEQTIERAKAAGVGALVITIDTPVAGLRERDLRAGQRELLSGSLVERLRHSPQVLARPGWLVAFLRDGGTPPLANVIIPGHGPMPLLDVAAALARHSVAWEDLRWIRRSWPGPIVIKGVLTAEDARRAADEGAAAVVVSNHGGRQLDYLPATLRALVEVAAAVGDRLPVLMDGGIRRGTDVVKALCLGAQAVLIGRAYAYGLAAAGEPGVIRSLEILRTDLDRTLRLLGCPAVTALDRSYVHVPADWH
jgi:L-lactate dehydrogenase (cytochrome)